MKKNKENEKEKNSKGKIKGNEKTKEE